MIGNNLIKAGDKRTRVHEVTDAVVADVMQHGNDSKYLRGSTIDKNRAHILTSLNTAVKIVYNCGLGGWQVDRHIYKSASGSSPVEDIHSDQPVEELTPCEQEGAEAHGCLAPKEDPLDVLYPVDNKLDLPF